jgi:hypothetical protein
MKEAPVLAQILARLDAIEAGQTETRTALMARTDRLRARIDRLGDAARPTGLAGRATTDPDDLLDSMDVDAVRDHIERIVLDRLDRRLPDVPLHQRGFGVMDEPPGGATRRSTPS